MDAKVVAVILNSPLEAVTQSTANANVSPESLVWIATDVPPTGSWWSMIPAPWNQNGCRILIIRKDVFPAPHAWLTWWSPQRHWIPLWLPSWTNLRLPTRPFLLLLDLSTLTIRLNVWGQKLSYSIHLRARDVCNHWKTNYFNTNR